MKKGAQIALWANPNTSRLSAGYDLLDGVHRSAVPNI